MARRASPTSTPSRFQAELGAGKVVVIAWHRGRDGTTPSRPWAEAVSGYHGRGRGGGHQGRRMPDLTDVDGVYTADPRIEPKARRLDTITFEEMLEMASLGAKRCCRSFRWNSRAEVPRAAGCCRVSSTERNLNHIWR